ncbi:ferrous iron transport protein A [Chloroflexota bacterium]
MLDIKQVTLSQMESGLTGKVVDVKGGHTMVNRLNAMNIRPGQQITKVSSMFMRGPVTIEVGNGRIAIGFGMAKHITVEI